MSHWPPTWPVIRSWVDGGAALGLTGTIVTCRPWAANRPLSLAMYRPAESMAGKALTTMLVFSSLSGAVPLPDPPEEHPAASIVTATADAMSMVRGFITLLHQGLRIRWIRDQLVGRRDRQQRLLRHDDHKVPHRPS